MSETLDGLKTYRCLKLLMKYAVRLEVIACKGACKEVVIAG